MDSRIIPVTLAVANNEERERLERIVREVPMARVQPEDAETMGVLIYEPGASADEDFPHIFQALESGQAEDVFLVGAAPDPELLIQAMRHGIREFLRFPVTREEFRAALMRVAMRESLEGHGPRGRLVSVLGSKAGLGVTTLAVNLACAVNERMPGEVAVLDLRQPVGEVPLFLDMEYEFTWGELVDDISRLDATYLRSAMAAHESGLHVLPAPTAKGAADGQEMALVIEYLRQAYPVVVVDCGPLEEGAFPKAVEQADAILMVTDLSMPALARTARLMETLRTEDPDAERRIRVAANRVTRDAGVDVDEAQAVLEKEISWRIPDDYAAALSALNQGVPWLLAAPRSHAAKEIRRMAADLVPGAGRDKGKGLTLSSLFRGLWPGERQRETDETVRVGA
ncbi:AAA family ATPase [Salidesulfovibrio onnuriiensis]|uniref:AAA family ATPase n=1 Tax=Salidesulfovibrio onnuriiensis TaxID=2583823 RepID=UPI0011C9C62C|nr:histidine kinase [Salidesulfovibrio onnuriiensis]